MYSSNMPVTGTLKVGDKVTVFENLDRPYMTRRYDAVVTKAARVWLDLAHDVPEQEGSSSHRRTWRMRRTTQSVDSRYSNPDHFRTAEQIEWQNELKAANDTLKAAGITVNRDSPWDPPMQRVRLADMIAPNRYNTEEPQ